MVMYRNHTTRWDGAELDAMTEEDWAEFNRERAETQRIMTPLADEFFRRWDEEEDIVVSKEPLRNAAD